MIRFLKDLATIRNPSSQYTFLSYLHSTSPSRLLSFISLSTFAPTRKEYAAYMTWAADKVRADLAKEGGAIDYGHQVVSIDAVESTDEVNTLKVTLQHVKTGETIERLARNVIISTGGAPRIPKELRIPNADDCVYHSSTFLGKVDSVVQSIVQRCRDADAATRIAIVGGGQSSAEIFLALRSRINSALEHSHVVPSKRPRLDLLIRRGALRPSDDSPFSNEVFDPGMSQAVYRLDEQGRAKVMKEARNTNYSVVNPVTLEAVYENMYDQKVDSDIAARAGREASTQDPLMTIHPHTSITHAERTDHGVRLSLANRTTYHARAVDYDFVIAATGYDRQGWREMLFPSSASRDTSLSALFADSQQAYRPTARSGALDLSQVTPTLSTVARREMKQSALTDSHSPSPSNRSAVSFDSLSEDQTSGTTSPSSIGESDEDPMNTKGAHAKTLAETLQVEEDYLLRLPKTCTVEGKRVEFKPRIWIQGGNEDTHGISDSLLSVLAIRSGEVVSSLLRKGNFAQS